jgi:hypothetical protein
MLNSVQLQTSILLLELNRLLEMKSLCVQHERACLPAPMHTRDELGQVLLTLLCDMEHKDNKVLSECFAQGYRTCPIIDLRNPIGPVRKASRRHRACLESRSARSGSSLHSKKDVGNCNCLRLLHVST